MDLLQELLCGKSTENILSEWPSENSTKDALKLQVSHLIEQLPNKSLELIESIKDPQFSLDLCPDLIH